MKNILENVCFRERRESIIVGNRYFTNRIYPYTLGRCIFYLVGKDEMKDCTTRYSQG